MTITDVLLRANWPLGKPDRKGYRTTCPLHQGSNDSAFHYSDYGWYCYASCGQGTPKDLLERLGLALLPPKPILGVDSGCLYLGPGAPYSPSWGSGHGKVRGPVVEGLKWALLQRRDQRAEEWDRAHAEAFLNMGVAEWAHAFDTEVAAEIVFTSLDQLRQLHTERDCWCGVLTP